MPDAILSPFRRFSKEASAVGRLLSGYSTLELTLMNSVHMGRGGDLNAVLKSMFGIRGESKRIAKAETLGGPAYEALACYPGFRSAPESRKDALQSLDSTRLVQLLQV